MEIQQIRIAYFHPWVRGTTDRSKFFRRGEQYEIFKGLAGAQLIWPGIRPSPSKWARRIC